ncbi:hypothetical protein DZA65_03202 [Dickeya dianthicola]|uniref:hypothetical protein n=1 Tax=Dickeya dianthicola TaxID=204039 RepID=UPI000CD3E97E|nr:hypothetical protein [Dickeya dianthicola]AYC20077.1 hypothetical protein DZA65_03202 [Dickeya dianthicola]MBI0437126.1 hypothetical protein [Dickeya dianthicola]MBI0448660.1 hypothetical protein [Dickeya dianthicola]MBI0452087.1 hypothetical protein [Dickeya dianthicola]MBI0456335.1 hypothetical protein [Dickeya dianthicola]
MTDTRERAAARKRAERERKRVAGIQKIELNLDADELEMLQRNCAARRPGREPYDMDEYIQMLIRQDDARVKLRIKSISRRQCGKCGDRLPVASCPHSGDAGCWVMYGWHETKLSV